MAIIGDTAAALTDLDGLCDFFVDTGADPGERAIQLILSTAVVPEQHPLIGRPG